MEILQGSQEKSLFYFFFSRTNIPILKNSIIKSVFFSSISGKNIGCKWMNNALFLPQLLLRSVVILLLCVTHLTLCPWKKKIERVLVVKTINYLKALISLSHTLSRALTHTHASSHQRRSRLNKITSFQEKKTGMSVLLLIVKVLWCSEKLIFFSQTTIEVCLKFEVFINILFWIDMVRKRMCSRLWMYLISKYRYWSSIRVIPMLEYSPDL